MKSKNESLIKYLRPASKPSIILTAVAAYVTDRKFLTNWQDIEHNGWRLPCTNDKYDWCGIWQTLGCLHERLHEMFGKGKSVFVKQYQRSCYRPSCKECYLKWIARQANRSTSRIESYAKQTGRKPIHLMLMVHTSQHDLPYDLLKKRMSEILQQAKWDGGAIVFHPYKFDKYNRMWYHSPHFHLVGFGERDKISRAFGRCGWYVKIGEERKSVFQTFCYLLSHCGIRKGNRSVIWQGNLSYSKVIYKNERKITGCPICGCVLIPIWYENTHPKVPPERYFEGILESDGQWYPVETHEEKKTENLDRWTYELTMELFYCNNGIVLGTEWN